MPSGHAGLLPHGAGPGPLRSGRPHQTAAAAPLLGLDPELRAVVGSRCRRCSGRWTGSSVLVGSTSLTWSLRILALRPAPGSAPRAAPAVWSWTRTRSPATWRGSSPASAATWPVAFIRDQLVQAASRRVGTYRVAGGVCVCSAADERRFLDQVPGVRTAVIPNAADVENTNRAPGTRRPTAEPWSVSGSSPPSPISTAWSTLCPALCRRNETQRQGPEVQIPTQAGRPFRFDVGHHSDLKPATIPI